MKEVEAVAKDKWTSHRAVVDIIAACERKLAPKGVHDDPPDGKDEGKPATKTKPTPVKDDEDDEEQDEVEENTDKSNPPSPPASQGPLNNFETAFGLIDKLVSKPLSTFAPTFVSADNIERAGNFLLAVANAKRGGKKAA
jgi:hypothetical protein